MLESKNRFNVTDILFMFAMTFVLAFPGPSRFKAISILLFFFYMIFIKLNYYKTIKNNLYICGVFSFFVLAFLSHKWAIYPNAVHEQINNVLWSAMISVASSIYVIYNKLNVIDIANRLLPLSFLLCVNVGMNFTFINSRLSMGINENAFGRLAGVIACFFIYKCKKEQRSYFTNLMACILIIFVFLSGSRTSLILLVIYVLTIVFFEFPSKNTLKLLGKICLISLIIIVGYICVVKIDFLYITIGHRIESLVERVTTNSTGDASAITRFNMIEHAKELFLDNLWIGIGLNNFKYVTQYGTYAHNNYYELAACLGVLGVIIYYIPYVIYLIKAVMLWLNYKSEIIIPLSIILAFFVGDFGGVSYLNPISHVFVGISIGIIVNKSYHISS